MRYTTIIDITELTLYKNRNTRLVYLHLCLACGYHSEDRDEVRASLRSLASECGLTLSALRCALAQLAAAGLVTRKDKDTLLVKTFVAPVFAAPRSGKAVIHGSSRDEERQREISKLRAELDSLRKAWHDLAERGELDAYREDMKKKATSVKKRLAELGELA